MNNYNFSFNFLKYKNACNCLLSMSNFIRNFTTLFQQTKTNLGFLNGNKRGFKKKAETKTYLGCYFYIYITLFKI